MEVDVGVVFWLRRRGCLCGILSGLFSPKPREGESFGFLLCREREGSRAAKGRKVEEEEEFLFSGSLLAPAERRGGLRLSVRG